MSVLILNVSSRRLDKLVHKLFKIVSYEVTNNDQGTQWHNTDIIFNKELWHYESMYTFNFNREYMYRHNRDMKLTVINIKDKSGTS